jgi:hypothetical protein
MALPDQIGYDQTRGHERVADGNVFQFARIAVQSSLTTSSSDCIQFSATKPDVLRLTAMQSSKVLQARHSEQFVRRRIPPKSSTIRV